MQHRRDIQFVTTRIKPDRVEVLARLQDWRRSHKLWPRWDKIHHMEVTLQLDPKMVITQAQFETFHAPYLECQNHVISAAPLVGLSLAKGFTKKVLEIYGGTSGCSHILTLLTNMASAVRQGFAFTYMFPEEEKNLTEDTLIPTVQKMGSFIEDSCMVWKHDSIVQKDLKKGRLRYLPERLYPHFASKMGRRLKRFR